MVLESVPSVLQGYNRVNRTNDNPVVIGGDSMFWPQLYGSQKVPSCTLKPYLQPSAFSVTVHALMGIRG